MAKISHTAQEPCLFVARSLPKEQANEPSCSAGPSCQHKFCNRLYTRQRLIHGISFGLVVGRRGEKDDNDDKRSISSTAAGSQYEASLPPYTVPSTPLPPSYPLTGDNEYELCPVRGGGIVITHGNLIKYTADYNPPKHTDADMTLHSGALTRNPIVAAAAFRPAGADMRIWFGNTTNDHVCRNIVSDCSSDSETLDINMHGVSRQLRLEITAPPPSDSSLPASYRRNLIDPSTGQLLAVFERETFYGTGSAPHFRWYVPLSRDEEVLALIACLACEERMKDVCYPDRHLPGRRA